MKTIFNIPTAFQSTQYRIYWLGAFASVSGYNLTYFAQLWLIHQINDSTLFLDDGFKLLKKLTNGSVNLVIDKNKKYNIYYTIIKNIINKHVIYDKISTLCSGTLFGILLGLIITTIFSK